MDYFPGETFSSAENEAGVFLHCNYVIYGVYETISDFGKLEKSQNAEDQRSGGK